MFCERRTRTLSSVKDRMAEIIQEQPGDVTYEEIMRELAFERMVERGLAGLSYRKGYFQRRDGSMDSIMAEIIWTDEAER